MRKDVKKEISISEALAILNEDVSKMSWIDIQCELAVKRDEGINPLYEDSIAGDYIYELMGKVEIDLDVAFVPSVQGGYGDVYIYPSNNQDCEPIGSIDFIHFCNEVIDLVCEADTEEEFIENYKENILAYIED